MGLRSLSRNSSFFLSLFSFKSIFVINVVLVPIFRHLDQVDSLNGSCMEGKALHLLSVFPWIMSGKRPVIEVALDSVTKDLPLGKRGFRWTSGSRLSTRLTKTREHRHILKENQTRYELREAQIDKKIALMKDAQQINVYPMPRFKETKKVTDFEAQHRKLKIDSSTVTITEGDLTKITPEVLPLLGQKIRDFRATGQSWSNITLHLLQTYTAHLKGTYPTLSFFLNHSNTSILSNDDRNTRPC